MYLIKVLVIKSLLIRKLIRFSEQKKREFYEVLLRTVEKGGRCDPNGSHCFSPASVKPKTKQPRTNTPGLLRFAYSFFAGERVNLIVPCFPSCQTFSWFS